MSTSYALPGYQANPAWINNELCEDSSHDHLPAVAQSFIRRGCCLPQKQVGRYVGDPPVFKYKLQHRRDVPKNKVDEVNDVGKEAAKKRATVKPRLAPLKRDVAAEESVEKESAQNEIAKQNATIPQVECVEKEIAAKKTDKSQVIEHEVTKDEAAGKASEKVEEKEDISKHVAATRSAAHTAAKDRASEETVVTNKPTKVTQKTSNDIAFTGKEESGFVLIEHEEDMSDDFEVVEGGGPSEEEQSVDQNIGLVTKVLNALRLI